MLKKIKSKISKFIDKYWFLQYLKNNFLCWNIGREFKKSDYHVGLISINIHTKVLNFACPLHTWAFSTFLDKYNVKNTVINYKPCYYGKYDVRHPYDYLIKRKNEGGVVDDYDINIWKELYNEREVRFDKFEDFISKHYRLTDDCYTQKTLDEVDLGFDAYMCVTDVIWKYNGNAGYDRGFFLNCNTMKYKPKIAYAASVGPQNEYAEEKKEEFEELIAPIDYIATREKKLYQHINKNTEQFSSLVIDPVLLQKPKFYKDIMIRPDRKGSKKGYVLLYVVMERRNVKLIETAVEFAKQHDLELIELSEFLEHKNIGGEEHKMIYDIGIEEWLGYIYDADYIITNSFHCCIFSMLFEKQFYAGKRKGDKLPWLLELFGIKDRQVSSAAECNLPPIDYKSIRKLKKLYASQSKLWALKALKAVKNGETVKFKGVERNFIKKTKK